MITDLLCCYYLILFQYQPWVTLLWETDLLEYWGQWWVLVSISSLTVPVWQRDSQPHQVHHTPLHSTTASVLSTLPAVAGVTHHTTTHHATPHTTVDHRLWWDHSTTLHHHRISSVPAYQLSEWFWPQLIVVIETSKQTPCSEQRRERREESSCDKISQWTTLLTRQFCWNVEKYDISVWGAS